MASSLHPAAAALAWTWAGVVAPAITEFTPGWDSNQPTARSIRSWPWSPAKAVEEPLDHGEVVLGCHGGGEVGGAGQAGAVGEGFVSPVLCRSAGQGQREVRHDANGPCGRRRHDVGLDAAGQQAPLHLNAAVPGQASFTGDGVVGGDESALGFELATCSTLSRTRSSRVSNASPIGASGSG